MAGLGFAPGVLHRHSKRGLIIADASGAAVLFDHPQAHALPALLDHHPTAEELTTELGPPLDRGLVETLIEAGLLVRGADAAHQPAARQTIEFSRSGMLFPGIARPARWINRHLLPLMVSWPGTVVLLMLVVGGLGLLTRGPIGPVVTHSPAWQAIVLLLGGTLLGVLHEFGHAVALVSFGRVPERAGFGFYWGDVSFFVDSAPALTLPWRQRLIQASAGLMVDVVTSSALLVVAHLVTDPFVATLCWQLAVLNLIGVVVNALPILEVDGHWAVADLLDEPELSPRARGAFAQLLRGRRPAAGLPMAFYGAFSLVAGLALLIGSLVASWQVMGELIVALFTGNLVGLVVGVLIVGPMLIGLVVSAIGLLVQSLVADPPM